MKHHRIVIAIILSSLSLAGIIYAQVSPRSNEPPLPERDQKTQQLVDLAHQLYTELGAAKPAMTCSLEYTVNTAVRDRNDSLIYSTLDVSYTGSQDQLALISPEVSLYQDTLAGVTISPSTKEIQIFPSTSADLEKSRLQSMQTFHNKLFTRSNVLEARKDNQTNESFLVIEPDKNFRSRFGIERVEITLSEEERRIHSIRASFAEGLPYESVHVTYNSIHCSDSVQTNAQTFSTALEMVLNEHGKVKPEYRDFEVIDHRTVYTQ